VDPITAKAKKLQKQLERKQVREQLDLQKKQARQELKMQLSHEDEIMKFQLSLDDEKDALQEKQGTDTRHTRHTTAHVHNTALLTRARRTQSWS
jgi:hypothetical protein